MSLTPCERHLYTDIECYVIYESTKLHDCPLCRTLRELDKTKLELKLAQESLQNERDSLLTHKCNLHDLQVKHTQTFNELMLLKEELQDLLELPESVEPHI
jgi:hypothetical protein